jgi:hypothetical protein
MTSLVKGLTSYPPHITPALWPGPWWQSTTNVDNRVHLPLYAVMAKTSRIESRVTPEIKAALDKAAQADARSTASLINKILVEWVKKHNGEPVFDRGWRTGDDQIAIEDVQAEWAALPPPCHD